MVGVAFWGSHMGLTQGLLASMVTDTAPAALRGTAFGADWCADPPGDYREGIFPGIREVSQGLYTPS